MPAYALTEPMPLAKPSQNLAALGEPATIVDTATLPIRVDKSHLVAIGERLYAESIELVRELVNNAYDADVAEVLVTITDHEVSVADNGLGMDLEGLHSRTPRKFLMDVCEFAE